MRMWWLELIKQFLGFGTAVTKAVEKGMDSDELKEKKFDLKHERLELEERDKIYRKIINHLQMHPRENIDAYINVVCDSLDPEDTEAIRVAAHKRFKNREERKIKIES